MRFGGPDGGNGGRGGAVVFVADKSVRSLAAVRGIYQAAGGVKGQGGLRHGKNGQDITIAV